MNWTKHKAKWIGCTRCLLCEGRSKVVLARGSIPAPILIIGEAPGECITGDTLIETAFRDKRQHPKGVPISSLVGKSRFQVYSYDLESEKLVLGNVNRVWKTGFRVVYEVKFFWWGAPPDGKGGRHKYYGSIQVTDNHPFLLKNGEYRSISQGLRIGSRLMPFYRFVSGRRYRVGIYSGSMKKEAVFLMENKIGRSLIEGEQVHHDDRNPENDSEDNLILLDIAEHARLHGLEDNAMFNEKHRETHRQVMDSEDYRRNMSEVMKEVLAKPEVRAARLEQIQKQRNQTSETVKKKFQDPCYYYRYLKGRRWKNGRVLTEDEIRAKFAARFPSYSYPPEDNHEVISITKVGVRAVYDMEVEDYNNFAANGIFIHNSEDVLGKPFCGPAGKLLDSILEQSIDGQFDFCITNLVGCIPREDGRKVGEPPNEAIEICRERVIELTKMVKPSLLILVGALASKYVSTDSYTRDINRVKITHPAAILRMNIAAQPLEIKRAVATISDAIEDLG